MSSPRHPSVADGLIAVAAPQVTSLLLESVVDYAIFALDASGRVISWNPGASRLYGYQANEILGESFTKFYPPEAIAMRFPRHELEKAGRDGRSEDEGWRVRKDGSRFWANVIFTALRSNGELVGFAKVTRDLTLQREAEEQARRLAAEEAARLEAARRSEELSALNRQLRDQAVALERQTAKLQSQNAQLEQLFAQQKQTNLRLMEALAQAEEARNAADIAAAAAREAVRELDQFAYVASHDLRAPLRGIANLAQWIQEDMSGQLGAESAEHLRLLLHRVARMEALIQGILDYSRAGRKPGPTEPLDTTQLVNDVIELITPAGSVTFEVAPGMPTIDTERVPLQQVFMNLLGNAVRYTSAVRSDGHVRVASRDADGVYEFSVSDNGPGIAPEYHERIWGIFQTLHARDTMESTGIGLSVVRKIVESRGGRAWVESTPGEGATFRFTWPDIPRSPDP